MSLSATCKAECDGCPKVVINEVELNDLTSRGIMKQTEEHFEGGGAMFGGTYARDIWSWCIPEGWIQCPKDEVTGQEWLFFCSVDCRVAWLRKQGRDKEAEAFSKAIWVA